MSSASSGQVKLGAAVSTKQIAHAVKAERLVEVWYSPDTWFSGYIIGADDYHWIVIDLDLGVNLVHKSGSRLRIHPKRTIESEPQSLQSQIRQLTDPFRRAVLKQHFSQEATTDAA